MAGVGDKGLGSAPCARTPQETVPRAAPLKSPIQWFARAMMANPNRQSFAASYKSVLRRKARRLLRRTLIHRRL
jgi:hypothetical protein